MTRLQPALAEMSLEIRDLSLIYVMARSQAADRRTRPRLPAGRRTVNRLPMSPAAAALLRCLIGRANVSRDRILLTDAASVDWRSLTFNGERHELGLRIAGPDSHLTMQRMCDGLEDAEFSIPGVIVADIAVAGAPVRAPDGSTSIRIEALTVAAD